MPDSKLRLKMVKRIYEYSSLYKDYSYLTKLDFSKVKKLYYSLFIPLLVRQKYKNRRKSFNRLL